jgi:hypothetical protein
LVLDALFRIHAVPIYQGTLSHPDVLGAPKHPPFRICI